MLTAFQVVAPPAAAPGLGIDPVTVTLIGGMIVTIIGTLATAIVSIITALRVQAVKTDQATTASQLLAVAKDTEAIKGHVNSEKTAAEGRETALRAENHLLRETVEHNRTTAALLAQAQVRPPMRVRSTDAPTATSGDAAAASLDKIDDNTAAIEKNTAKTDAAVQEMKD